MRQTRRRHQQWRVFALTVILVAAASVAAHYGIEAAGRLGTRRQPVTVPRGQIVEAGTKLVWVTDYALCGDQERRETAPDTSTVGLDREQLQSKSSGWTIESFAGDQIILRRTAQICQFHLENRTLKLVDGRLVLFYGTPSRLGPKIDDYPDVSPESLAAEDRAQLEKGMLFISSDPAVLEEKVQAYLEGITE